MVSAAGSAGVGGMYDRRWCHSAVSLGTSARAGAGAGERVREKKRGADKVAFLMRALGR